MRCVHGLARRCYRGGSQTGPFQHDVLDWLGVCVLTSSKDAWAGGEYGTWVQLSLRKLPGLRVVLNFYRTGRIDGWPSRGTYSTVGSSSKQQAGRADSQSSSKAEPEGSPRGEVSSMKGACTSPAEAHIWALNGFTKSTEEIDTGMCRRGKMLSQWQKHASLDSLLLFRPR